jgi:deoxyribodipyrimidine photo-lyase
MPEFFHPTPMRSHGLKQLKEALPKLGLEYARNRNLDRGKGRHNSVTRLSPWLRHRLLLEEEVISSVLSTHTFSASEKFIEEVFWRTYWKGWLESRPSVWENYIEERDRNWREWEGDKTLAKALAGKTGIECFDYWIKELKESHYLHNHSRMWFASIWIFTLGLPWTLGADVFMRFLLDGDPASNTLSWRWVAGLQTHGKCYIARPDNIAKWTVNRFSSVSDLVVDVRPPESFPSPEPVPLEPPASCLDSKIRTLLILHDEDLCIETLPIRKDDVVGIVMLNAASQRTAGSLSDRVFRFVQEGLFDAKDRFLSESSVPYFMGIGSEEIFDLFMKSGAERIVTPYAPVGPTRDLLHKIEGDLEIDIIPIIRIWDKMCWPHASKGFFAFKKKIPSLVATLCG